MPGAESFEVPAGTVVLETAVDFEQLDRQLKTDLRRRAEAAGAEAGQRFQRGFDDNARLDQTTGAAQQDFRRLGREADRSSRQVDRSRKSVRDWREEAEGAGEAAGGLGIILGGALTRGMRGFLGLVTRGTVKITDFVKGGLFLAGAGLEKLGDGLERDSADFEHFGRTSHAAGAALKATGFIIKQTAAALTGIKIGLIAATAGLVKASEAASAQFTPSWNRVLTIIPKGAQGIQFLRHEAELLGATMGRTADVTNEALYQILSAMPQLADKPLEALKVLRPVLEATASGFGDAAENARVVTSILNAYGKSADEARDVTDALFAAQNQGVLTFGELAGSLGQVLDLSSALKADYRDLLAVIATTTPTGGDVSETVTQLRGVLAGMIKPTDELNAALGGSASGFLRQNGLVPTLERIVQVSRGNPDVIAQMFGRKEAQALIVSLAQHMGELDTKLRVITDSSGETTRVFDQMQESIDAVKSQIHQELVAALGEVGQGFESLELKALKAFEFITRGLAQLSRHAAEFWDFLKGPGVGAFRGAEIVLPGQQGGPPVGPTTGPQPLAPIARPGEPLTAKFSKEKIDALKTSLKAQAAAAFAATHNMDAYQQAIRDADRRVNGLILTEANRLRQGGAEEEQVQELLAMYQPFERTLGEIAQTLSDPQLRAVQDALIGADTHTVLRQAIRDLGDLGDQLRQVQGIERGPGRGLLVNEGELPLQGRLQELRQTLKDLGSSTKTPAEKSLILQQRMEHLHLTVADLTDAMRMNIRALGLDRLALQMLGFDVPPVAEHVSHLSETLAGIESAVRGILSAADAIGILDDKTRRALQGVVDLAGGIRQIATPGGKPIAIIGGAVQAVGGLVEAISGLAGDSERQRLIQANTEALHDLKNSLDRQLDVLTSTPGAQFGGLQKLITAFFQTDSLGFLSLGSRMADFFAGLDRLGLSMSDLEKLANDLGIQFDRDHLGASLKALSEALGSLDLQRALQTFTGRLETLRHEWELFGATPIQKLEDMRDLLLKFTDLPSALQAGLQGADLSTPQGQAQFRKLLQQILEGFLSGRIGLGALGDQLTLKQLEDLLDQMSQTLDQASQAGGGHVGGVDVFRGISEIQANAVQASLDTIAVISSRALDQDADRNRLLELMLIQLGGQVPAPSAALAPPAPATVAAAGGGFTMNGDINVEVDVTSSEDPAGTGREIGRAAAAEIDRRLGELQRSQDRLGGRVRT